MRVLALRLHGLPRGAQRRLAELAGLSPETVSRWKAGRGNPRQAELEALADAMGVSVAHLVSSESTEEPTLPGVGPDGERASARVERLLRRAERIARELTAATAAARERP